jgi:membrane-bound metal-dependent hydrolase YbcI (DUF457 family)
MHPYRGWPFLSDPHYPGLSAVWAIFVHGALSLIVVLPILLRSERRLLFGVLAFMSGSAIDLDHAVAAGSFNPRALEHLSHRPETHSLVAALALALVTLALTRRRLAAWSVFAVVMVHLLFDAPGGGVYWLYPLERPDAIPWLACPIGILALTGISWILAYASRASSSSPTAEIRHARSDIKSARP